MQDLSDCHDWDWPRIPQLYERPGSGVGKELMKNMVLVALTASPFLLCWGSKKPLRSKSVDLLLAYEKDGFGSLDGEPFPSLLGQQETSQIQECGPASCKARAACGSP